MALKNLSGVTKNEVKTVEFAPNLGLDKESKKCNCHQRIFDDKKRWYNAVLERLKGERNGDVDNVSNKQEIICIEGVSSDGSLLNVGIDTMCCHSASSMIDARNS